MSNKLLTLKQLDRQLLPLKGQEAYKIPPAGWTRTLRKALGLTIQQFAHRLGVVSSRVVKIESAEKEGAITLRTLETVAQALECQVVYSFIPNASLEMLVKQRARKIAEQQVKKTAHTMALEAQSVDEKWLEEQIQDLSAELLRKSWKHLWEK